MGPCKWQVVWGIMEAEAEEMLCHFTIHWLLGGMPSYTNLAVSLKHEVNIHIAVILLLLSWNRHMMSWFCIFSCKL